MLASKESEELHRNPVAKRKDMGNQPPTRLFIEDFAGSRHSAK